METLIGTCAAILTTASFIPQALHIIRTRETAGISLVMYCVFACGLFLWLIFGVVTESWPIIGANAITLALSLIIIYLKFRFEAKLNKRDPV
ncbi:MAG: SemiSWEET transporter [Chitinophagales bacterium]|nr:SemiSWEET transporter [Hyphomicrobiales bacterium]